MIRVKICGLTSRDDALAAVEAGADALGFIFVERTPEEIERIVRVCGLSLVQLHGQESPDRCDHLHAPFIKAIRVRGEHDLKVMDHYPRARAFLLDTHVADRPGGTGRTFPWEIAAKAVQRATIILSGGLTPNNVALAVTQVRPYGIDVCSGVEASAGRKDYQKVREFIEHARTADAH